MDCWHLEAVIWKKNSSGWTGRGWSVLGWLVLSVV